MKYFWPEVPTTDQNFGVFAPSSQISHFPMRLKRGIKELKSKFNLEVKKADHLVSEIEFGRLSIKQKSNDFSQLLTDKNVGCILGASGGYNSIALFKDFNLLNVVSGRKPICGFSDLSAMNVAITMATGLITFSGPSLLPVFGIFDGVDQFTFDSMHAAIFLQEVKLDSTVKAIQYSSDYWDLEDDRPATKISVPESCCIGEKLMKGRCFSGNLNTLVAYSAAGFINNIPKSIWFIDDNSKTLSLLERDMIALIDGNILSSCNGIIVSRNPYFLNGHVNCERRKLLFDLLSGTSNSIVVDAECGHTLPMMTIPNGALLNVEFSEGVLYGITE